MPRKYSVLIVDDNSNSRLFLRKTLESRHYRVMEAVNGKEALSHAKKNNPDIIISDILMPVMDGFQLCMRVKEDEKLKKIPFIFYTATYTSKKDEEFALGLGAARFIVKPLEPDKFLKIIEDVLNAYEEGTLPEQKNIIKSEKEVFKLFNERLVNKLEKKMLDLEKETEKYFKLLQNLKNSEDLLNATQELTKSGGWRWNIKENTMFWTDGTYLLHEADPSEIQPGSQEHIQRGLECYDEKDRETILEAFKKCSNEGIPYDLEFPFTTFKGKRIWIRTTAIPVKENNMIIAVLGTLVDITDIKIREIELDKHRNHLENLVKERTLKLEKRNAELEEFNDLFVNREFRIKDLKDRIKELEGKTRKH